MADHISQNSDEAADDWRTEAAYLESALPEICGHTFLAGPLSSKAIIVDLGGSTAAFARGLAEHFGCACHVAEASSANFARIPESHAVRKYHRAIGGADGPVDLMIAEDEFHWGSLAPLSGTKYGSTEEVTGVTLQSFFAEAGISAPDLVKVDIEGAEIAMFASAPDSTLQGIGQLTVEFHDFMEPGNATLMAEVAAVKARLDRLGFNCFQFSHPHNGDVLFVNRARIRLPAWRRVWYGLGLKYGRGITRIARRWLVAGSGG